MSRSSDLASIGAHPVQLGLAATAIVVGFLLGLWVGESRDGFLPGGVVAPSGVVLALVSTAIACAAVFLERWMLVGATGLTLLALAGGLLLGNESATQTYHDNCVRGERHRKALVEYMAYHHGSPPTDLTAAGSRPQSRFLRGRLLQYEPTEQGFRLTCTDGVVRWEGTDAHPMEARK